MKKRAIAILVCVMLVLTLLPGAANAMGNTPGLAQPVAGQSWKLPGCSFFEMIKLEFMVAQANWQIDLLVKRAQLTPQDDVAWTLRQIDRIVAEVFAYAKSIGATVVCEYVEYYIDGQYVLIDPIRIIRL